MSLQQTLQLIRVTVEVDRGAGEGQGEHLREAILLYSREIAFAAADVYARAAEARGLWDARLEALVVDSILTGEADEELPSRIAALGWHGHGEVSVLVGHHAAAASTSTSSAAPRASSASTCSSACRASRLVLVIGRADPAEPRSTSRADATFRSPRSRRGSSRGFGSGPPRARPGGPGPRRREPERHARRSAGFAVARAWRHAPRPVEADDLLPERALAGDPLAKQTLVERIYRPLQAHSADLVTTLWSYLDNGRSLEATARELFVHPTPCATGSSASPRSSAGTPRVPARR